MFEMRKFSDENDALNVTAYTFSNEKIKFTVLDYGAIIQSLLVKNSKGTFTQVVLGYDIFKQYAEGDAYIGATIGRFGNRINEGKFTLNGVLYQLPLNDGPNSLHGGFKGFDQKMFDVLIDEDSITLSCDSADMEEGYPGNLKYSVKYTLLENGVKMDYFATTDKDTIVNFTNHTYFNFTQGKENILGHKLMLDADYFTEVGQTLIPTGKLVAVENTPFDFRKMKTIGDDIHAVDNQLEWCGGFDHNFVLNGQGYRQFAKLYHDEVKISMTCFTDLPAVQFYSGNFLTQRVCHRGTPITKRYGLCLETQNYPDAINHENFPSCVLKAGEEFTSSTAYVFDVE